MPWKENYTSSDEAGIRDGDIQWPDGKSMALGLTVNLNPASSPEGISEKDLSSHTCHFGMHEGLSAFLELFKQLEIKATFAVPALIAEAYPEEMQQILAAGHEIAGNGLYGEDPNQLEPGQEAAHLQQATEVLHRVIGQSPKGWYSLSRPDDRFATGAVTNETIGLLKENGYQYFGNGLADDSPYYWVSDFEKRAHLLSLPYYYHFDDTFFLMFPRKGTGLERPDALKRNWHAEFRAQYRRKRYFNMCVSPARSGWGHRFDNLAEFLTEAVSHPGVWAATGADIADHWNRHYPAKDYLNLSEPIWQDYEDSLS